MKIGQTSKNTDPQNTNGGEMSTLDCGGFTIWGIAFIVTLGEMFTFWNCDINIDTVVFFKQYTLFLTKIITGF